MNELNLKDSMPEMPPEEAERRHKHPEDMIVDEKGGAFVPITRERRSMLASMGQDVEGIMAIEDYPEPEKVGIIRRFWRWLF